MFILIGISADFDPVHKGHEKLIKEARKLTVLNGVSYTKTTDENGIAYIPINLSVGLYDMVVSFAGDDEYHKANIATKINVINTVCANINISNNVRDDLINITLTKPISDEFAIEVAGNIYIIKTTNEKGLLKLYNLNNGDYLVKLDSDKYNSHNSSNFKIVVNMNIESNALITYYNSGTEFVISLKNNDEGVGGKILPLF